MSTFVGGGDDPTDSPSVVVCSWSCLQQRLEVVVHMSRTVWELLGRGTWQTGTDDVYGVGVADWCCVCEPEARTDTQGRSRLLHSVSCAVRRADGSRPPHITPHPVMLEPVPEEPPIVAARRRTAAERAKIIPAAKAMREAGHTYVVIARYFGVTPAAARAWCLNGG